jgi:hypothetical protein
MKPGSPKTRIFLGGGDSAETRQTIDLLYHYRAACRLEGVG